MNDCPMSDSPGVPLLDTAGHPRVDAMVARLDRVGTLPPAEQVSAYAEIHQQLQATLAELDEGS